MLMIIFELPISMFLALSKCIYPIFLLFYLIDDDNL
jgi:hypothetical protein